MLRRLTVAAVVVVALAGCGADDEGEPPTSPAQARAFARAYAPLNADLLALQDRYLIPLTVAPVRRNLVLARRFEGFARQMRALVRRERALRAPGRLSRPAGRLAALMESVSGDLAAFARESRSGDRPRLQAAGQNVVAHSIGMNRVRQELARRARELARQ